MKKFFTNLAVILVAAVVLLAVGKNVIAKSAIERVARAMTGCELRIGNLNIGLLSSKILVNNLQLHNPPSFADRIMVDLPELYVSYDPSRIFSGKPHLRELRVHLRELMVVKNAKGELNLMALKPKQSGQPENKNNNPGGAPPISIDLFRLKVEKVIYKDYSRGVAPFVQEFNINLDESYQNVSNINAIVPLIVKKALLNTAIASLANFNVDDLISNFSAVGLDAGKLGLNEIQNAKALLGSTATTALGKFQAVATSGTADKAAETAGKAAASAGKSAEKAAEGIKNIFGSLGK